MDLDVGFIDIPGATDPATPAAAKMIDQRRCELRLPLAHRFMTELDAAKKEHLGQIAQAEFVAEPPEHHERDDIGGILGPVQNAAGAFIELFAAIAAAEAPITLGGTFPPLRHRHAITRDAPHHPNLASEPTDIPPQVGSHPRIAKWREL